MPFVDLQAAILAEHPELATLADDWTVVTALGGLATAQPRKQLREIFPDAVVCRLASSCLKQLREIPLLEIQIRRILEILSHIELTLLGVEDQIGAQVPVSLSPLGIGLLPLEEANPGEVGLTPLPHMGTVRHKLIRDPFQINVVALLLACIQEDTDQGCEALLSIQDIHPIRTRPLRWPAGLILSALPHTNDSIDRACRQVGHPASSPWEMAGLLLIACAPAGSDRPADVPFGIALAATKAHIDRALAEGRSWVKQTGWVKSTGRDRQRWSPDAERLAHPR